MAVCRGAGIRCGCLRERHQLALAGPELPAPARPLGVVTVRHPLDELVCAHRPRGVPHVLVDRPGTMSLDRLLVLGRRTNRSHLKGQCWPLASRRNRWGAIRILDEATPNVDVRTESQIERGLRRILAGRTALVVAHRLSTIRGAGRIVVLDRSRIGERERTRNCWRRTAPTPAVSRLGRAVGGLSRAV
jgi:hypothetical protein